MSSCGTESVIECGIRCVDPRDVEQAMTGLDPGGQTRVAYVCKLSGAREEILVVGSELAERLADAMPDADDPDDAKILAALSDAELCECDVATVTGLSESDVLRRLRRLCGGGVLGHRKLDRMNYYRLQSEFARQSIAEALELRR